MGVTGFHVLVVDDGNVFVTKVVMRMVMTMIMQVGVPFDVM
jgi:hypothetical protein